MSGRASLPELVAALRSASGIDSSTGMLRWLLGHAFFLRLDEVGINSAFLNWGSRIFQIGGLVYLGVALWLEMLVLQQGLVWAGVAMVALGFAWCLTCLGVNVILLMLTQQIRLAEAIDAELEAAERVQQQLLPSSGPAFPGLEVAGSCAPAREVGGDYYDYFEDGDRVVVAIADVAGKGLSAALLMTMAKGALGAALQQRGDLHGTLTSVHEQVLQNRVDRRLVTMALLEIDRTSKRVRVARAGHEPPILVRGDGELVSLLSPGIAVGIGRNGQFASALEIETVPFERGDLLVLYTDGMTEARNEEGEEFGSARLEAALRELGGESAEGVRSGLLARLEAFRGTAPVMDDVTLVVVRASG
jgi:sigma-B regulation protein RsbU (phosphoserine phosphatase)